MTELFNVQVPMFEAIFTFWYTTRERSNVWNFNKRTVSMLRNRHRQLKLYLSGMLGNKIRTLCLQDSS